MFAGLDCRQWKNNWHSSSLSCFGICERKWCCYFSWTQSARRGCAYWDWTLWCTMGRKGKNERESYRIEQRLFEADLKPLCIPMTLELIFLQYPLHSLMWQSKAVIADYTFNFANTCKCRTCAITTMRSRPLSTCWVDWDISSNSIPTSWKPGFTDQRGPCMYW